MKAFIHIHTHGNKYMRSVNTCYAGHMWKNLPFTQKKVLQWSDMLHELNIKEQCLNLKMGIWECPHFLFVIMGMVIIVSMVGTNIVAQYYTDPEVAALAVIAVTGILFVISHTIVRSFERIAEANHARAEFISIVSHQLRNPLSSIRWQLEILLRDETVSKKTRSYLEDVNEYNNRMAKLVNDLLTVNRIESNQLVLAPISFSLPELTRKIIHDNMPYANASNVTLELQEKKNIPPAYADEQHMRWAVENLVSNAVRYSTPRTTVTIRIEKKGHDIYFEVINRGIPITSQDLPYIFKKFYRAESAQRARTDGSGLGLFIAKSVVEASHGTMGFDAKKTGETIFWFTLPRIKK